MKYTAKQINETIERASKIYNKHSYMGMKLTVLKDLRRQMISKSNKDLSPAQARYLNSLMGMFTDEILTKAESWAGKWDTDKNLRERGDVISKYYIANKSWFLEIAATVQQSLTKGDVTPDFHMFNKMVFNEYAEKVWQSHNSKHRWAVGSLVCCRANANISGWTYQIRADGIDVYKDPCMVIKSGSMPISSAAKYDDKRGGCRWVSINPIGTNYIFHVMEKDLKVYRQPKKKTTKRSKK